MSGWDVASLAVGLVLLVGFVGYLFAHPFLPDRWARFRWRARP